MTPVLDMGRGMKIWGVATLTSASDAGIACFSFSEGPCAKTQGRVSEKTASLDLWPLHARRRINPFTHTYTKIKKQLNRRQLGHTWKKEDPERKQPQGPRSEAWADPPLVLSEGTTFLTS